MDRPVVTLYTRANCHLCEEAKANIRGAGCESEYLIQEIDVDTDPVLKEKYGLDIPVVLINGVKVFKHRVDPREFRRKLRRLAGTT